VEIHGDDLRLVLPSTIPPIFTSSQGTPSGSMATLIDSIHRQFIYSEVLTEDGVDRATKNFVPRLIRNAVYSESDLEKFSELRKITAVFIKLNSYPSNEFADPTALKPFNQI
jgi:hypothetical protein